MTNPKRPALTWAFEEGRLTIKHPDRTVSLGRYATRELAAKAAALYIRKHAETEPTVPVNAAVRGSAAAKPTEFLSK